MNSLALADALEQLAVPVRVQTAIAMQQIAEPYIRNRAIRHLEKGRVVIFGCGTGNPFFTTDTAAALRAAEIDANIIFKATNVDGVYDRDPNKFHDAVKFDTLSHFDILQKGLNVMDSTAASLCKDNNIPILVFNLDNPHNIVDAVLGKKYWYNREGGLTPMEMKQVYENANERMHKTIRALNGEYDSIRAGRANASVLDKSRWILWRADPDQPDGGDFRGGSRI